MSKWNRIKQWVKGYIVNHRWDFYLWLLVAVNIVAVVANNDFITGPTIFLDCVLLMHVLEKVTYICNQIRDQNDYS